MDKVVSEQAGFELVHCRSIHVLQTAEKASVQITPVIPQGSQIIALNKLLQLLHYLIHLERAKQGRLQSCEGSRGTRLSVT